MEQYQTSNQRQDPLYSGYSCYEVRFQPLLPPSTLFSRMLIKKVNSTFESLEKAKDFMNEWNDRLSKTLRDILLGEENQEFLKELFTSTDENLLELLGKIRIMSL